MTLSLNKHGKFIIGILRHLTKYRSSGTSRIRASDAKTIPFFQSVPKAEPKFYIFMLIYFLNGLKDTILSLLVHFNHFMH